MELWRHRLGREDRSYGRDRGDRPGQRGGPVAVAPQDLLAVIEGKRRQAGDELGPLGDRPEHEAGHDPEVSAATPERPHEIAIVVVAGVDEGSVGEHDIGADEVIGREAVAAVKPADAAAEREPGEAGRGVDPDREGEVMGGGRGVDIAEQRPGLHHHRRGRRVDGDCTTSPVVDDDAAICKSAAGHVVATAADRDGQAMLDREPERPARVLRIGNDDDGRRPPVDHPVPAGDVV